MFGGHLTPTAQRRATWAGSPALRTAVARVSGAGCVVARWRFRLASGCELYLLYLLYTCTSVLEYMLRARLGVAVGVWSWHVCCEGGRCVVVARVCCEKACS